MKKVNGHEIITLFEQWSPKRFAMEGDPVGLHIGQLNRPIEKVLVTLDVNEEIIDEAVCNRANLVIAHHPPIFRPLKSVLTDTPQGRMIEKCIKNDIAVYAAHTNLDVAPGGVNDMLASKLGLIDTEIVEPTYEEQMFKLDIYSPVTHADAVRRALGQAGAGAIGDYAACSFSATGTGRFTPNDKATPYVGANGIEEAVAEEKIEVIVPESIRHKVLKAVLAVHPYEEPAYDFFVLDQPTIQYGLGRIGKLIEQTTLAQFAEYVKNVFGVPALRFVGDPEKAIHKVAVLGGDGNKYISAAKRAGADVLVTGDLYYHVAHDAEAMGLAVIDPGHNIEKVMIEGVVDYMQSACKEARYDVSFIKSEVITEPFNFI